MHRRGPRHTVEGRRSRMPARLRGRAGGARLATLAALVAGLVACSGGPGVATGTTVLPLTGGGSTPPVAAPPVSAASHGVATVVAFVTTPVHRGQRATITASTAARARCDATVTYTGTSVR